MSTKWKAAAVAAALILGLVTHGLTSDGGLAPVAGCATVAPGVTVCGGVFLEGNALNELLKDQTPAWEAWLKLLRAK